MQQILFTTVFLVVTLQMYAQNKEKKSRSLNLSVFAESKNQWTGIAISKSNRVFVNFPRWSDETPISVAELVDNEIIPYPNTEWNDWANHN
ncbi:MAG TPA: hypothetical protein VIT44_04170, partial [Cyclobacteriaceae bacterium]